MCFKNTNVSLKSEVLQKRLSTSIRRKMLNISEKRLISKIIYNKNVLFGYINCFSILLLLIFWSHNNIKIEIKDNNVKNR